MPVDGIPMPNRYRHFRIKTVDGIDDPGMMAEVIRRRFSRLCEENASLPNLAIVDGGITQLRAARRELDALGLTNVPAAGLAKQFEEIHYEVDGIDSPIRFPDGSAVLSVLKQIRDEAHRFALTYHRKLRSKKIRESVLDEIPGVGKKRKEIILKHFGSIRRLEQASANDLAGVPGIGPQLAQVIRDELEKLK